MNFPSKAFLAIFCFCLVISFPFYGCSSANPPTTTIVNDQLTILPCTDDAEGEIHFENVTITTGILDKKYTNGWYGSREKGDPCYLISGQIRNDSSTGYYVIHLATGYDVSENVVSFTLDSGPLAGIAVVYVEAKSTVDFVLHLSWADNVTRFIIQSQKSLLTPP
jgi:hypothetical protein